MFYICFLKFAYKAKFWPLGSLLDALELVFYAIILFYTDLFQLSSGWSHGAYALLTFCFLAGVGLSQGWIHDIMDIWPHNAVYPLGVF